MRIAIFVALGALAMAATPASAQGWMQSRMMGQMCAMKAAPADNSDRLAKRLNLTDPQKAALKDFVDASAAAMASTKSAMCTDKPDMSTTPARLAFGEKLMETQLAGMKSVEPKLQAFYDTLDAKQKTAFDTGGRVGGMFDWFK
jgi:LTXXQ motif family protein